MGKKSRKKHHEHNSIPKPIPVFWWKKVWAQFTLIPIATLVAILGLIYSYKTAGSDELRTKVYQPLFTDLENAEEGVQAVSTAKPPFMNAVTELKRTGALEQIPNDMRAKIVKLSEKTSTFPSTVDAVREIALREISSRISKIRTEQIDKVWQKNAANILRERSKSKKGFSDSISFTMKHEGRSPAIDVRDPNGPIITGPGGPAFVVRDWLTYPTSVDTIEELWTDVAHLYFNENKDAWYYQLTREDLKRLNISLTGFLKPVYEILKQSNEFQLLIKDQPVLLSEVADMKAAVADRVRDPKQLRDLISR